MGIDLTKRIEEIESGFSKNHKRSIKKAINSSTYVKEITTRKQVDNFAIVFSKMWNARNLPNHFHDSAEKLWSMLKFFKDNNQGAMKAIYNEQHIMMGGIILFFEGDRLYYDSGASDPSFRKIPVMHRLIYEAIKFGKENGFSQLDLGGYNLLASKEDQKGQINRFKDGFGGQLLIYPKQMKFVLNSLIYFPFKIALWLRNQIS